MCFSLPGLNCGILVSLQLSLLSIEQVKVSLCWASRQQETLIACESAQFLAPSVRTEQIHLLLDYSTSDFYFWVFPHRFHRRMFQPGLEHPWYQERKSSDGLLFL